MLDVKDITLICPRNDLESATIINLALGYEIDVRISDQAWGGVLGKEPMEGLSDLKAHVVIVELPGIEAEERLRTAGHEVIIIDHHSYRTSDRGRGKSSIEQFCELIGHPMDEKLWRVAINDRDFIPGLFGMGLSYLEMAEVRRMERQVLGTEESFHKALECVGENRRSFEDLDVILAPRRFKNVMGEAAQWPGQEGYEGARKNGYPLRIPNCLIVYHEDDDQGHLEQVEYFGDRNLRPAFEDLLADETFQAFDMWMGGGANNCFWGAKARYPRASLDLLIDEVLSFTLIKGRPLRDFSTTLLFPFCVIGPNGQASAIPISGIPEKYFEPEKPEEAQEVLYFLPHIRELMYRHPPMDEIQRAAKDDDAICRWDLPMQPGEEQFLEVRVGKPENPQQPPIKIRVSGISLYRFFNNLHMLSVSVSQRSESDWWEQKPYWRRLVEPDKDFLLPSQALTFNQLARIVYLSFPEQPEESKIGNIYWLSKQSGNVSEELARFEQKLLEVRDRWKPPLSPILLKMIECFIVPQIPPYKDERVSHIKQILDKIEPVIDDRMFVHTCLAISGRPPKHVLAQKRYHALFSLATYVDCSGWESQEGYSYDQEFTQKILEPFTNRRWFGISGNLYGFSHYSAAYLGFEKFFHTTVTGHVRTMYLRLSVISLFYRASILHYAKLIAEISQPVSPEVHTREMRTYREQLRDIHWGIVRFANKHWFRELTYQEQGLELFEMQLQALEVQHEYDVAIGDVQRAYEFLDSQFQARFSRLSAQAGWFGLGFAILALIIGVFGMNFSPEKIPIIGLVLGTWEVLAVILFLVFALPIVLGIWWRYRRT